MHHSTAMIPFDTAEKKVAGGAWCPILSNHLSTQTESHEVLAAVDGKNGPTVDCRCGDSGVLSW